MRFFEFKEMKNYFNRKTEESECDCEKSIWVFSSCPCLLIAIFLSSQLEKWSVKFVPCNYKLCYKYIPVAFTLIKWIYSNVSMNLLTSSPFSSPRRKLFVILPKAKRWSNKHRVERLNIMLFKLIKRIFTKREAIWTVEFKIWFPQVFRRDLFH